MEAFFGYLFVAPLTAGFFGFLIWLIPAILLRERIGTIQVRPFAFFVTGYVFTIVLTLYLLIARSWVGPIAGTVASLGLVWLIRDQWLRRKPPASRKVARRGGPPQPGQPGSAGPQQVGYPGQPIGQPGYAGQPRYPGQPGQPGYSGQPGYPGVPGYPAQPVHPGHPAQPPQPGQPGYQGPRPAAQPGGAPPGWPGAPAAGGRGGTPPAKPGARPPRDEDGPPILGFPPIPDYPPLGGSAPGADLPPIPGFPPIPDFPPIPPIPDYPPDFDEQAGLAPGGGGEHDPADTDRTTGPAGPSEPNGGLATGAGASPDPAGGRSGGRRIAGYPWAVPPPGRRPGDSPRPPRTAPGEPDPDS
ncbi:hypothetical protein [Candidatus Frankia alpina]|uniref:Uncharacterized protein n=1 Tax=Candidatus Frankia alpina TaxID=2699483 RepID=A0A4S5EUW2_9ACTN|nr:hypothetical protein [Candidatus Frankia alpina]THJ76306.1 hypothetical protein E7Y31_00480 [Candidatus Frankia alpina]